MLLVLRQDYMLPKKNRLTKREDFTAVYSKGLYVKHNGVVISYSKNNNKLNTRIGFSIGNSFSKKATERNRVRRIFREACFFEIRNIRPGFDIIVSPKPGYQNLEMRSVISDLRKILEKANLIIK